MKSLVTKQMLAHIAEDFQIEINEIVANMS